MKILFLVACCLLLGACQGTTFQTAPLAELPCDGGLAGQWLSISDDKKEADGEVELRIDASCHAEIDEHEKDGTRTGPATLVHVGRAGRQDYLWVDAGWALARFGPSRTVPAGDVFVMRYRLRGNRMDMQATDDKAIAHLIIDEKIPGDVSRRDGNLLNRITGDAHPEVLAMPGVFEDKMLRFRRGDGSPRP
jgi:hypothetical protein